VWYRSGGSGSSSLTLGGHQHATQAPTAGDALQLVLTAILEQEARAGNEILDRLGDEDLPCTRARRDAGLDRHAQSCRLALDQLALPGMHAGADLDAQRPHALGDLQRGSDRPRGPSKLA
jgi:hypothetical protein